MACLYLIEAIVYSLFFNQPLINYLVKILKYRFGSFQFPANQYQCYVYNLYESNHLRIENSYLIFFISHSFSKSIYCRFAINTCINFVHLQNRYCFYDGIKI